MVRAEPSSTTKRVDAASSGGSRCEGARNPRLNPSVFRSPKTQLPACPRPLWDSSEISSLDACDSSGRKLEHEDAARAWHIVDPECASVRVRDLAGQRQTEPETGPVLTELNEGAEHLLHRALG